MKRIRFKKIENIFLEMEEEQDKKDSSIFSKNILARNILAACLAFVQSSYDCKVKFKPSIETYKVYVEYVDKAGNNKFTSIYTFGDEHYTYDRFCDEIGLEKNVYDKEEV